LIQTKEIIIDPTGQKLKKFASRNKIFQTPT